MAEYIVEETVYPLATRQEAIGELIRCKDCHHFHIQCEYRNPYEWGTAVCDKYDLITDFRTKKKFETLSCIEEDKE